MQVCFSHGKIDKETQSPLLNIFKEIMTREKDDPEKRNLLNEPREEKKRRQYSGSRNKADRRSCESSGSEHRKRGSSNKISSTKQTIEFNNKVRNQSVPYQNEKKDSWWFWQNTPPKKPEESYSCVSCALKKIVSSEYACIGCLLLLFTISIIVAFLVVFKNVPNIGGECKVMECKDCKESTAGAGPTTSKEDKGVADSDRLKRKIEMLSDKRLKKGFIGINEFRKSDNKGYDDDNVLSGHISIPGVAGIDFGPRFRELNSVEESEHRLSNDLSNILGVNNLDIQKSEKLREFYKKLVETDAKIKSLKMINQDQSYVEDVLGKSPERSRRSLKLYHYPKRYRVLRRRRSIYGKQRNLNEASVAKRKPGNKTRLKRFNNEAEEPTGFVIEKKKLLVRYKPAAAAGNRRIPVKKCQHAPVGTHTHEKQMMHPFYKNTQRLDLLLDKFLNKNLPEIMSDPFGIDALFKHEKFNKPCKHPKPHKNVNIISDEHLVNQIPKPKFNLKNIKVDRIISSSTTPDLYKMLRPESTTQYERDFFNHEVKMIGKQNKKIVTASPSDFEILLSVSTIMNPELQAMTKRLSDGHETTKLPIIDRVPNLRRLMQLEAGEDEENLGYDDFKEVLTDDVDNHDEVEKTVDRKRRDNDQPKALKFPKFNPPQSVHNPNWKGAMPLYPDEVNSMLSNKADVPKPTDELQDFLAAQRKGRDLSDIEYVEDYISNKYNRLVQQAQAYSDYGVLDGKKESRNEKDSPTADSATNHKIKLSGDENFNRAGLLERLKRGRMPRFVTRKADIRKHGAFINEIEVTTPGYPAQTGIHSNYLKIASYEPKPHPLSEGIRIEMIPTTKSREDLMNNFESIMKIVSKHVKLKPQNVHDGKIAGTYPHYIHSSLISTCPDVGLVFTTKSTDLTTTKTTVFQTLDELESERGLLFAMVRGNRRLLSTGFESSGNFRDYKNPVGYRRGIKERNRDSIDRFVNKLHMNKNLNSADETALKNYIESVKRMNIKIFSTPGPSYDARILASETQHTISEKSIPITDPTEVEKYPMEFLKVNAELPESEVTINKSLVKVDTGDNFFGKILLTVKDPKFGMQNFNLIFDVPSVMNFKEELTMVNDNFNYPNVFNQFEIYNDSTIDPLVSDLDSYPDHDSEKFVKNEIFAKRLKREISVTATWSDSTETGEYTKKDSNVIENSSEAETKATIIPVVAFNSTNSTVSAAPTVTQTLVYDNRSADSTPTSKTGRYANDTMDKGDNMTLSEFFGVVANWFRTLEYGKQDNTRRDSSGSGLTDMLLTINSNITNKSNVSSTDSAYPLYDSDMIENIGHRSRVLLSVEDNVTNVTEENQVVNSTNATAVTATLTVAEGNAFDKTTSTIPTTDLRSNFTTKKNSTHNKTYPTTKKENKTKVKAIVKRNADDSNLIFWDDIYDDEYGIQREKMDNYMKDKLDDAVRDKHPVNEKDFIKRSGRWVQNKIRKFAKNLKISPHSKNLKINPYSNEVPSVHSNSMETKERVPRSIGHNENLGLVAPPDIYDRDDNQVGGKEKDDKNVIEEDYPDVDQKSLFAALSVNMKDVCKKAAKAVQQTRNMEHVPYNLRTSGGTKEESKQGSIASALMQQLVRLLTDLVEYQVQQKTCTELPAELQTFLEWLTYSKEEPEELYKQPELLFQAPNKDDEETIDNLGNREEDKSEFPDEIRLKGKQISAADEKTRYEDNLQSIQDLLEEYDEMTDDDKSIMLGVRGYLENQLEFLNQQLSAYELFTFLENRDMTRNKRDFYMKRQLTKHRPRRRPHKFIKTFGKKHTRTTAGYHDEAQVTEIVMNKKTAENKGSIHPASVKKVHQKFTKRNLKDVYYKAIAEAKKFSSAKIVHKKEESSRFETSTTMGHK